MTSAPIAGSVWGVRRSTSIAIVTLGACVLVAGGMIWRAADTTARRRAFERDEAARARMVETARASAAARPSIGPWDEECPSRLAPIADDPAFGVGAVDTHELVVAELDALLEAGRGGSMRELRDRHHGPTLDVEGSRLLGCAVRRNGSRANRLAGYVRRLWSAEGLRASAVAAEVGLEAEGLTDEAYGRLREDPRIVASDAENDREMAWIELAGAAADAAFRCVGGEPNGRAQVACDRVASALEGLR